MNGDDQGNRPAGTPDVFAQHPDNTSAEAFARLAADEKRAVGRKHMISGAVLMGIGIVITAVTYGHASGQGGTYVVAYGPIIWGAVRFVRGLAA